MSTLAERAITAMDEFVQAHHRLRFFLYELDGPYGGPVHRGLEQQAREGQAAAAALRELAADLPRGERDLAVELLKAANDLAHPRGDPAAAVGSWLALRSAIEAYSCRSRGKASAPRKASSRITLDERALAVHSAHPGWNKQQIAAYLKRRVQSLCPERCPGLHAAMCAAKDEAREALLRRRGWKDKGGGLDGDQAE